MNENKNSQRSILKATSIVGGAQVVSILINIIRVKITALLLGPSGVGIIGMFQSSTDLVKQITSFGISYSGVKEIADAGNKPDDMLPRKVTIVRRWALYTGIFGTGITIFLCFPLSSFAFNTSSYAFSIAILSITLLFTSVSNGQLTILQGLRQINQSAKVTIVSSIIGLFFSIPIYWFFGVNGIVPSMIIISIVNLISSWFYSRNYKFALINISVKETITEGLSMAKLGFFILVTSVVITFTLFSIRTLILDKIDLDAVGCFVAVYSITSLYLGIIFNAMQMDFYPKLSALKNNIEANKLMSHQIEIALIISTPILMLLIVFAELVIRIALSPSFLYGASVMQWQLFGGFLGIITWALGVTFLAKGKGIYSLYSEGLWCLIYYVFIFFSWEKLNFLSLGIGYLVAGIVRFFLVIYLTNKLTEFTFDKSVFKIIIIFGILICGLFLNIQFVSGYLQYLLSSLFLLFSFWFSFSRIILLIDIKEIYKKIGSKFQL